MKKNTVTVKFPSRAEQIKETIRSWTKNEIKMLLCHGVSYDTDAKQYFCDCGNENCKSPGKHPISALFPKGEHSASDDERFLLKALKKYPNANIAAVIKDFFVIDVDGPRGEKIFRSWGLSRTLRFKTGRGHHNFYKGTLSGTIKKFEQIDIKTKGYIMLEPSRHISGKTYRRVS